MTDRVKDATRKAIVNALHIFDSTVRDVNWKNWEVQRHHTMAIDYHGNYYPVSHIIWMATKRRVTDGKAREIAEHQGFKVIDLHGEAAIVRAQEKETEREFENKFIIPMIEDWRFELDRQYICRFQIGTFNYTGKVDILVYDEVGPITLFENKAYIRTANEEELAYSQAKSYALMLGLGSFVIASPEKMSMYTLNRNKSSLSMSFPSDELRQHSGILKNALLKAR